MADTEVFLRFHLSDITNQLKALKEELAERMLMAKEKVLAHPYKSLGSQLNLWMF